MKAGTLRKKIALQSATRTPDGGGGFTESWATISGGDIWASIEPASSREVYAAGQLQHRITHALTLRYLSGVTTAMRVLFGTRTFNVRSVLNVEERGRELRLLCEEGLPK